MSATMTSTSGAATPHGTSASVCSTETADSRKVVTGKCSTFVKSGRMSVACACSRGEFKIRSALFEAEREDVVCGYCCHGLMDHADFARKENEGAVVPGTPTEHGESEEEHCPYDTSSTTGANTPTISTSGASTPTGVYSGWNLGRNVLVGPCAALVVSGRMKVTCVCPVGDFKIWDGVYTGDEQCKFCCHGLQDHADFSDGTDETDKLTDVARLKIQDEPEEGTQKLTETDGSPSPLKLPEDVLPPDVTPGEFPRTPTLKGLLSLLSEHRSVQVMGPNNSGKTMLAKQLESFTKKNLPHIAVHRFHWPTFRYAADSSVADLFRWVTGSDKLWERIREEEQVLIIIDDIQNTMRYARLWEGFLASMKDSTTGPLVAAFGTSNSGDQRSMHAGFQVALEYSVIEGVKPVASLYYCFSEFNEAVQALCTDSTSQDQLFVEPDPGFKPAYDLVCMIWHYSAGHPVVIGRIVEQIRMFKHMGLNAKWEAREPKIAERRLEFGAGHLVSLADVYPLFEIFSPWVVRHLQCTYIDPWVPTLPGLWEDTDSRPYSKVFMEAVSPLVLTGATMQKTLCDFVDPWLELLEKVGWVLEDEDRDLKFATPFHRNFIENLALSSESTVEYTHFTDAGSVNCVVDATDPTTVSRVVLDILQAMLFGQRRETLKSRDDYRDLFWREAYGCLNGFHIGKDEDVPPGVDVTHARPFFTMGKARCSFDLMHNEDSFDYHVSMLSEGGPMNRWAQEQEIWCMVLLDMRSSIPTKIRSVKKYPYLYHVLFIGDEVMILNAALKDVTKVKSWIHKGCFHRKKKD